MKKEKKIQELKKELNRQINTRIINEEYFVKYTTKKEKKIEELKLEVQVLRANNKGLKQKIDEQYAIIQKLKKDIIFLRKELYYD